MMKRRSEDQEDYSIRKELLDGDTRSVSGERRSFLISSGAFDMFLRINIFAITYVSDSDEAKICLDPVSLIA
jgi:hypothetical protein